MAFFWIYVTIKNDNDEFERMNGFINYFKCYPTFRYGSASITEHFVEQANRCFPFTFTDHSTDDAHDYKLI